MKRLHYILILILLAAIVVPVLWSYSEGAGTSSTSSLNKGLAGYWDLNQTSLKSATTITDKSPNSNTGSISNTTFTTDQHGQSNKAMDFNGSNSNVSISDSNSLDMGTNAHSVAVWVNLDTYGTYRPVIAKRAGAVVDFNYHIDDGAGDGKMASYNGSTSVASTNTVSLGVWHHLVWVYNSGTIYFYLDGQANGSAAQTSGAANSANLFIGADNGGVVYYFDGKMSDVRLYNRAITTAEITLLYKTNAPKISQGSLKKGLTGYWPLDSDANRSTTITSDKTPYIHHGTSTGSPTLGGATDQHGQSSKATAFAAASAQFITIGNVGNIKSVSFWVNSSTTTESFLELINNSAYISVSSGTISATGFTAPTIYIDNVATTTGFTASAWHHIVITTGTNVAAASMVIGEANSSYFTGSLADVRVYDRAITAAEVQALFNSYRPKTSTGSLNKGLVGSWDLAQTSLMSSTVIKDKTPNSNNGTLVASPSFTTDRHGQSNKALQINSGGTNSQYVSLPDSTKLVFGNGTTDYAFSISIWALRTRTINTERLVGKQNPTTPDQEYSFGILGGTAIHLLLYDDSTSAQRFKSVALGTVDATTWHHYVAVYDPAAADKIKIYQDSVDLGGTTVSSGSYTAMEDTVTQASIGSNHGTSNANNFKGSFSDVRIYNRALSAAEVTALYRSY